MRHAADHVGIPDAPENIPAPGRIEQTHQQRSGKAEDTRVPQFPARLADDFMDPATGEAAAEMMIQGLQAERAAGHLLGDSGTTFNGPHLRTQRCPIRPLPRAVPALRIAHSITQMFLFCSRICQLMSQSADAPTSDMPQSLETMLGFNADLGFSLTEWADGYARLELDLTAKHLNRSGILHGGVVAPMIVGVGGYCGVWVPEGEDKKRALTLSLTTSFMGTTKAGRIYAIAKRRGGGRSVFFASCEIYSPEGNLIAMGEGTYKALSKRG